MEVDEAVRKISVRIMKERSSAPPYKTLPEWESYLQEIISQVERTALDRGSQYDER